MPERHGYDEAVRRIRGLGRASHSVDLAGFGLTELPTELANFRCSTLNISGNALTTLPDWLSSCGISQLNASNNQLLEVPLWVGRAELSTLNLADNALTDLPAFRKESLVSLNLAGNSLSSLPRFDLDLLAHGPTRFALDLSRNALTELQDATPLVPPLPRTVSGLNLSCNGLAVLPEWIGELSLLQSLDLSDNALTELPTGLDRLLRLTALDLSGNPLISPPPEICAAGIRAIKSFQHSLRKDSVRQWSSKMLVVGEAAVGKTSVSKALCQLPYDPDEPQTHGVHLDRLDVAHPANPHRNLQLHIWDFGGQLEYRATQRFYLTDRSLFLLVWNSRRGWRTGGQVEAWMQAITSAAPNSPVIIVATHCSDSVADIDETDLYRRYPKITRILRVDCKNGTGVPELREEVARQAAALPLMGARWPGSWSRAQQSLEAAPGRHISTQRVEAILRRVGIKDDISREVLLGALHDRGEILHFANHPELRDTIFLQPAWVEGMITRVLDSQQVADRGGLLSRAHRAELWKDLDDLGLFELLTALMERFDLAYRTDSPDHEDVALVVERLAAGTPEQLPAEWDEALDAPGAAQLRIVYKLPSRQAGVPSWFIAREHRFTTGVAWARGVLLRHRGASVDAWALLQDDDKAEPTLRLTVRGTMPHVFYSLLTEAFTGILTERYPGLKIHQLVPCSCATARSSACPHEFDLTTVQRALGHSKLQCPESLDMVDPQELLLGLRPDKLESTLARIESTLDGVAASTGRIEQSQLLILDTVRDLLRHRAEQGTHCPSIFTFTKVRMMRYELRLYCEQPDNPHPLPDGAGVYRFAKIPDWLRPYAPYLRLLLTGIKHGLPLVGPGITGVLQDTLAAAVSADLNLACRLLDELSGEALENDAAHRFATNRHAAQTSADFAALRAAVIALDPDFGGLRERELPENRGIVYLCRDHREALRYPAQSASVDT